MCLLLDDLEVTFCTVLHKTVISWSPVGNLNEDSRTLLAAET